MKSKKHYIWLGLKDLACNVISWTLAVMVFPFIGSALYGVVVYVAGETFLAEWFTPWAYGCAVLLATLCIATLLYHGYHGARAMPHWLEEKGRKYEHETTQGEKAEAARQSLAERSGLTSDKEN